MHDLNRNEEAIADFDKATALNPRYAEAFQNKGKSLIALKRGDEALAAFGRALAINSSLAEAWLGRGQALGGLGHYDEALSAYDRALALILNSQKLGSAAVTFLHNCSNTAMRSLLTTEPSR